MAIRRESEDFVIAFQPEDTVVFRHSEGSALQKACVVEAAAGLMALIAEMESPGTGCCLRLPQRRAGTPSSDGRDEQEVLAH